jgi:hypothetical protein
MDITESHPSKLFVPYSLLHMEQTACLLFLLTQIMHAFSGSVVGLRRYATSRKIAGSIPDEVTGFFY